MNVVSSLLGILTSPVRFLREVLVELKAVTWPSPGGTLRSTAIVIVCSVLVGLYVAGLDYLATTALNTFIVK